MHIIQKHPRLLIILWLVLLLLVGGYLRIHNIANYYYNPDEFSDLSIAQGANVHEVAEFAKFETHPVYPSILRHYLLRISDAPVIVRGESAFFGLLCILVYYCIGKNFGSARIGCIAAFLVTFSYGNILQSQVIRNYTLLMFLLGCTYWCYQRFIETKLLRYAAFYTGLGLLSLMTHYSAVFMCFAIYSASALFMLREKQFQLLKIWTLANLIIAAYFGYMYYDELQHNVYLKVWKIDDQIVATTAPYNTFLFRAQVFFGTILFTILYFICASSIYALSCAMLIAFLLSLYTLYFVHRHFWVEALLALLLGASLTALHIYPYAFNVGNRYASWAFPFIILPLSIIINRGLTLLTPTKRHESWLPFIAGAAFLSALILCQTSTISADAREHPLTLNDEKNIDHFLDSLTSQDFIIAGGLGTISLLPDTTTFYRSFTYNTGKDWYVMSHHGTTPIAYTLIYPPLRNGVESNSVLTLSHYLKTGLLDHAKTVWLLDSGWSMIWDDFIECMVHSGKAVIQPELSKAELGEYAYAVRPKFIGFNADMLRKHDYTCK